jgi:hypothetical protein
MVDATHAMAAFIAVHTVSRVTYFCHAAAAAAIAWNLLAYAWLA